MAKDDVVADLTEESRNFQSDPATGVVLVGLGWEWASVRTGLLVEGLHFLWRQQQQK